MRFALLAIIGLTGCPEPKPFDSDDTDTDDTDIDTDDTDTNDDDTDTCPTAGTVA